MAAGRVNKLKAEVTKLLEVRQVIMPLQMSEAERLESITLAFIIVLNERATDITDTTMEITENDTKVLNDLWEKARKETRKCIASVMETTAVTVGMEKLCNYVFHLRDPVYVD